MALWLKRGARYVVIGVLTFIVDLALLFLFIDGFDMNVLIATAVAFLIALSLNYVMSRRYVFPHSARAALEGYGYFLVIAIAGMAITVALMWALLLFVPIHFALSRIIVAAAVGVLNYGANLYLNFKVVGVEIDQNEESPALPQ